MSVKISFSKLFIHDVEDPTKRMLLENIDDGYAHIHGRLKLEISGNVLPSMGFFGPDDVCFNTWTEELSRITQILSDAEVAENTFDEGEQGQPAFSFKRQGDLLLVSVKDSMLSGAEGDASYQDISCSWPAFQLAVAYFMVCFRKTLLEQCPAVAEEWWRMRATT